MTGRARPRRLSWSLDGLLVLLFVAVAVGTLLAVVLSAGSRTPRLADQAHEVAATLRCPVCENQSAADSAAPMAAQMRRQIVDDLRRGRSADEIRAAFVRAYGDTILLSPPRHGAGAVAYALPFVVVVGAAAAGGLLLRRLLRTEARS